MRSITEIKRDIEEARSVYLEKRDTASIPEVRNLSKKIRVLQQEMSDTICEGAKPCPTCSSPAQGIEQPRPGGKGIEYEVGCTRCGWFVDIDGTVRDHGARGGLLPRHTVEAWNEGPNFWKTKTISDEEKAKLPKRVAK